MLQLPLDERPASEYLYNSGRLATVNRLLTLSRGFFHFSPSSGEMASIDWDSIRAQMLLAPGVAYLNTGSYGIVARSVFARVTELRRQLQMNPVDFLWRRGGDLLWNARCKLAAFIQAEPKQVIFTDNVTTAMNLVAASLRLPAPGDILMSDHEYGAVRFAWERAAQFQGLSLKYTTLPILPSSPDEVIAAFAKAMTNATRVLFLSHVLYTTGMVLPLRAICAEARRRGILTVVDAAHALGMVPINVQELGCDFYGANLHKWLLAPVGAGFLSVRPGLEDRLLPLTASWGWHVDRDKAFERDDFGGTPWLRSFEFAGSRDITPWLVVPDAIAFQEQIGLDAIRSRQRELSECARAKLTSRAGLELATPAHPELRGAIAAFCLTRGDPHAVRKVLWERHQIEINMIEHAAGPWLRVSTHFYNTEAEIELLASSMK
jgi:isopenicillin-N epimerase